MNFTELVDRLAGLAGIEPWYFEINGQRHETSLATKVLVLSALGFDISSIKTVHAAVTAKEEENWRSLLAPFVVQRAEAAEIDLFVPAALSAKLWRCEILSDSGEVISEEFHADRLALLGMRDIDGMRIEHRRLQLKHHLPLGYHKLRMTGGARAEAIFAAVPPRGYLPPALQPNGARTWGIASHLYTVKSGRNWGVGDFSDLAALANTIGSAGGSAIAVNPFHALFPHHPDDASPYSPSSRRFLNPIYVDTESATFADRVPELRALAVSLAAQKMQSFIDYREVWTAKAAAFERLYRAFLEHGNDTAIADAFAKFRDIGGKALEDFAVFSTLAEMHGRGWMTWPEALRDPRSFAVASFAREHEERIAFHCYLQFLADRQLAAAQEAATRAGMHIGIVRDVALGINPDGADAWAGQDAFVFDLRCGAPPDEIAPQGQEWGVLPMHPLRLARNFGPYAELLRANMKHAGGLRIDHVIGLQRQYLVPLGAEPSAGCYVRFPLDEMLSLLALESHLNHALVIGEDLGTVPEGFREHMQEKDVFGCAILYFERLRDGTFKPPGDFRMKAAVSAATHDLPTLKGYFEGRDIDDRRSIELYTDVQAEAARAEREQDCARLIEALNAAGFDVDLKNGYSADVRDAVHTFLASTSAQLFLAQLDDLSGEGEQLNLPGTTIQHANWRRRLSKALEDPNLAAALSGLARICAERGRRV